MSFGAVIGASLGKAGTLTAQLAVVVNNLGGLVVFLIIIGDVLAGRADEPGLLEPFGCVADAALSTERVRLTRRAAQQTVGQPAGGGGPHRVPGAHAALLPPVRRSAAAQRSRGPGSRVASRPAAWTR